VDYFFGPPCTYVHLSTCKRLETVPCRHMGAYHKITSINSGSTEKADKCTRRRKTSTLDSLSAELGRRFQSHHSTSFHSHQQSFAESMRNALRYFGRCHIKTIKVRKIIQRKWNVHMIFKTILHPNLFYVWWFVPLWYFQPCSKNAYSILVRTIQ